MEQASLTYTPVDEIPGIVDKVRKTFRSDVTKSQAWRKQQLDALEQMLLNEQDSFLGALEVDVRKPRQESYASEIAIALEDIRIARDNLHKWMSPESVKMPMLAGVGASTKVIHEPLGVALIIGAWNYPVMLTIGPLVGAIAAGCTAVLKPSELTPATSLAMEKAVAKYLDPAAYTVVQGGIPETTAVLEQRFDQIFFTGSPAVGKIVMAAAAKNLTPVVLELGGKSPAIVCEDAKLDSAVRRIAWGKFYNAGQTCIGVDYVLVHESKYEEFLTKTYETIEKMYGADPQASRDFPRIVDKRNVARIEALFANESVVFGGEVDLDDRYISPTVVRNPAWDSPIMNEEIFGPVMPVIPFTDLEAELDRIIDGEKPLATYIFTEDHKTADHILGRVSSGGACVNDTLTHVSVGRAPFGGVGHSGIGRYHGHDSYLSFTHRRTVLTRTTAFEPSFLYPPYNATKDRIVKAIV